MSTPEPDAVQVDPAMVLTRVAQHSELGAALVQAASWRVLAEHHAQDAANLREQLAALQPADDDSAKAKGQG